MNQITAASRTLTRGLPPPDPRSLCPLSSTEFVEHPRTNFLGTPLFWDVRLFLKCDGTRAETRFLLSAKRTSSFKSAGASVQSATGNRGVRIIGSNAGYTMFRGSVKSTGYSLHSPVSPSLPIPCVIVCHHISTGLYSHLPSGFKV